MRSFRDLLVDAQAARPIGWRSAPSPLRPWLAASTLSVMMAVSGHAQEITPDPQAWRPLSYSDLQRPSDTTRTYADIWRDAIEENNRVYLSRRDARFRDGNAPVTEAHFVIWSPRRSVVLSIINTATGCTLKEVRAAVGATVKLCPMRLAVYEGIAVRTMEGGKACFLELAPPPAGSPPDSSRAAAYGSYDPAAKVVKVGLVIEGRAVDGCSLNVPLYPP